MTLRGLLITGTDTGVGKTRISCAIVRELIAEGHRVGAMKPVASSGERRADGSLVSPDTADLWEALGSPPDVPLARITPIVVPGDLAPSVAMRLEGLSCTGDDVRRVVGDGLAWWAERAEILIVEGVGGFLCPIAERATVADLAEALDFPVVVVARRGLGTLNHTLLTVDSIQRRGLRPVGIIMNGSEPTANAPAEATNPDELSRYLGDVPILADLPHESGPARTNASHGVDWWERARPSRVPPSPPA